jgi:hypothetical protein
MNGQVGLYANFVRNGILVVVATAALGGAATDVLIGTALVAQAVSQGTDRPAGTKPAKEAELQKALFVIREAIDTFYRQKQHYPPRLGDLVTHGYLTQIPTDPFTNRRTSWRMMQSQRDAKKPTAPRGVFDVKSGSTGTARNGTKYSTW